MSFSLRGLNHTARDTFLGGKVRRAGANLGQHLATAEIYLKLALRAQNQWRSTLEALAAMKNPPVVFVRQANIAHGPQQVNNHAAPALAHAEKFENPQTELLENDHGQRLDTGATAAASGSNQAMETVEAIHRPTKQRRKAKSSRNVWKGATRALMRRVAKALAEHREQ